MYLYIANITINIRYTEALFNLVHIDIEQTKSPITYMYAMTCEILVSTRLSKRPVLSGCDVYAKHLLLEVAH